MEQQKSWLLKDPNLLLKLLEAPKEVTLAGFNSLSRKPMFEMRHPIEESAIKIFLNLHF